MKKILTAICVAATTLTACNDNFLEKYPLTDLTEENAFKEYENFKAFMNPCYDFTPIISSAFDGWLLAVTSPASGVSDSHSVTGGVYKARERIHRGMLTRDY